MKRTGWRKKDAIDLATVEHTGAKNMGCNAYQIWGRLHPSFDFLARPLFAVARASEVSESTGANVDFEPVTEVVTKTLDYGNQCGNMP